MILGQALEKITGKPMASLLRENILGLLVLKDTNSSQTDQIPGPVLHASTSERRKVLGIAPSARFCEESTS